MGNQCISLQSNDKEVENLWPKTPSVSTRSLILLTCTKHPKLTPSKKIKALAMKSILKPHEQNTIQITKMTQKQLSKRKVNTKLLNEKLQLNFLQQDTSLSTNDYYNIQKMRQMSSIVESIVCYDQDHLISIINQKQQTFRKNKSPTTNKFQINQDLYKFLKSVSYAKLQSLDMIFYNFRNNKIQFHKYLNEIPNHLIQNVTQKRMKQQGLSSSNFEEVKRQGLDLIKNDKVCFYVLLGGNSFRFQHNFSDGFEESQQIGKSFYPLNIPSKKSIIENILHRFKALSQRISKKLTIYIQINPSQIQILKQIINKLSLTNHLKFFASTQKMKGAFDLNGKLVINDSQEVPLFSTGNGDIWNVLQAEQRSQAAPTASMLIQKGFQYIEVIGSSNALEKCFDCYNLGFVDRQKLDWSTKIVESIQSKYFINNSQERQGAAESKIFIDENQQIYVCDPQQIQNYPENCNFSFINHSIFSLKFLIQTFNDNNWHQYKLSRIKVNQSNQQPPYSHYKHILSIQKDLTNIISYSSAKQNARYKLMKCQKSEYCPLIYKSHTHSDIQNCSISLSNRNKKLLNLANFTQKCEIDPSISLDGQGLQQILKQLQQQQNQQDLEEIYITAQQ